MGVKKLDFQASISDVKQINPLFSTCKIRILYTGKNRNMSIITREAVEKALPTMKNVPIVGEFSIDAKDYKGHGGAFDADTYDFIHTTKPYGIVPESATYEWETVGSREYLTIYGCLLWTGRYEEAYSILDNGKGQSMEIEVTDGRWIEEEEAYQIDNFIFSALCILGDDVEPAFEDAKIMSYSLDDDSFKREFNLMLEEFNKSLSKEKEDNKMLKELLEKYSITLEDIKDKGINLNEISEDELEAKIIEVFNIESKEDKKPEDDGIEDEDNKEDGEDGINEDGKDEDKKADEPIVITDTPDPITTTDEPVVITTDEPVKVEGEDDKEAKFSNMQNRIAELESQLEELEDLRKFKNDTLKADHEAKASELFNNFQLEEEDVKDIDVNSMTLEEIEDKCYSIIGRKMAKKNFSKDKDTSIRITVDRNKNDEKQGDSYQEWLASLASKK